MHAGKMQDGLFYFSLQFPFYIVRSLKKHTKKNDSYRKWAFSKKKQFLSFTFRWLSTDHFYFIYHNVVTDKYLHIKTIHFPFSFNLLFLLFFPLFINKNKR